MTQSTTDKNPANLTLRPKGIFGLRHGDLIAARMLATGRWFANTITGEITNASNGRPVRFTKEKNGYHRVSVQINGKTIRIYQHRAVWIAAYGIFAMPLDLSLVIDHINHDKSDNRIQNLRLIPIEINIRNRGNAKFTDTQITEIRRRISAGEQTNDLAEKYGVAKSTIHNIKTYKTYRDIEP